MATKDFGIEVLRSAVNLFNSCNETFNQRYTPEELMRIAKALSECEWDIYPDQWEKRQLDECIQFGISPKFEYCDESRTGWKAVYHNEGKKTFKIPVSWTASKTVDVYARTLKEAVTWAEGDMPTPKDGVYVDDTFEVSAEVLLKVAKKSK